MRELRWAGRRALREDEHLRYELAYGDQVQRMWQDGYEVPHWLPDPGVRNSRTPHPNSLRESLRRWWRANRRSLRAARREGGRIRDKDETNRMVRSILRQARRRDRDFSGSFSKMTTWWD
jgi:hypothetical protein